LECLNPFEDSADIDEREKLLALRKNNIVIRKVIICIINDKMIEINVFSLQKITNNYE
jgi:hypothetical protein